MTDVVMRQESSDYTLSVKELDVVLPRYQPFKPPLHHCHFDGKDFWYPVVKYLHPPDEDELERQMELDKKELDAAAVLPPDNPAPVDGLMSPSFFDFLHPSRIVYRKSSPDFPYSPGPITYSPPTPGGHVPTITYEPRNDALHAVAMPCSKKIGLHCYNLEKGTNFEPSGLPKYLHLPDEDELERQMELDKKELRAAAVLPPDNPAPVDGLMSPSFFDYQLGAAAVLPPDNPAPIDGLMSPSFFNYLPPSQIVYRKIPPGPPFSPRPITYSPLLPAVTCQQLLTNPVNQCFATIL